jgi:4'-phosphopantetheinyl transferase
MMDVLSPLWLPPPASLSLESQDIHLWCASLEQSAATLQKLARSLSDDEQERASRFRFPAHQQRFIAGRGILRTILGQYLAVAPAKFQFDYAAHGKPSLQRSVGEPELQFNLSHSQDLAVYAIARHHPVGIDLEFLRPVADMQRLAQRFFSAQEYAAIQAFPSDRQQAAFFQYWTGKEALLKAIGQGLTQLEAVELLCSDVGATVLRLGETTGRLENWSVQWFVPAPEYMAAIAVESPHLRILFWQWQDASAESNDV